MRRTKYLREAHLGSNYVAPSPTAEAWEWLGIRKSGFAAWEKQGKWPCVEKKGAEGTGVIWILTKLMGTMGT